MASYCIHSTRWIGKIHSLMRLRYWNRFIMMRFCAVSTRFLCKISASSHNVSFQHYNIVHRFEWATQIKQWQLSCLCVIAIVLGTRFKCELKSIWNIVQYPRTRPLITITRARGLTDDNVANLLSQIDQIILMNENTAILYEIIEHCKEYLHDRDQLHLTCSICLDGLDQTTRTFATSCAHYFHARCFSRYWHTRSDELLAEKQLLSKPDQMQFTQVCLG